MSYLRNLADALLGKRKAPTFRSAAFPGADISRLTSDWTTDPGAVNRWLRYELRTMRARARQLARGESYGAKFVRSAVDNIAGPTPFTLQAKVRFPRGKLDAEANKKIEVEWRRWSRVGACEVTRKFSLNAVHRLIVRSLARDGEALYRVLRGPGYGYYGIKLQLLDIDRLDEDRNDELSRGAIKMGVQVDGVGAPVAYHLLRKHPGETGLWGPQPVRDYDVVPAEEVRHLYLADWPEQVRGFPWLHAAMVRLYHLGAFEEAAVIAARIGASQMILFEQGDGAAPLSSVADGGTTETQTPQISVQPGTAQALPYGWKVAEGWDPRFPDQATEPFIRACLRGIAAGVGMAYHSFANDPSNVNYSTARVALLEERDMWSSIQQWYVEHNCEPLYLDWLRMSSLTGRLPEGFRETERFESVRFQPKRWDWVDPRNEVEADVAALESKLTSRTRIAAARGEDIEEIAEELAQEQDLFAELDLEEDEEAEPAEPAEAEPESDKAIERIHSDIQRLLGERSNVTALPTRFELIFNQAPVTVSMPERSVSVQPAVVRNEFTIPEREVRIENHAGDTHVTVPERSVSVETPVTVNPAAVSVPVTVEGSPVNVSVPERSVTVEGANVNVAVPERSVTVEGAKVDVTVPEREVTVNPEITIEVPESDVTTTFTRDPRDKELVSITKRTRRKKG